MWNTLQTKIYSLGLRAKDLINRKDSGEGAVSFILIVLGVIIIAGIVIAAVTAYINSKTGELGL